MVVRLKNKTAEVRVRVIFYFLAVKVSPAALFLLSALPKPSCLESTLSHTKYFG